MSLLTRGRKERDEQNAARRQRIEANQRQVAIDASREFKRVFDVTVPTSRWAPLDPNDHMDSGRGWVWACVEDIVFIFVRWWDGNPGNRSGLYVIQGDRRLDKLDRSKRPDHRHDIIPVHSPAQLAEAADSGVKRCSTEPQSEDA